MDLSTIEEGYSLFCTERFPLPTELQVAKFEHTIASALPPDFRTFLLRFNGGYFSEPDITTTIPGCPLDRLNVLYGVGANLDSRHNLSLFYDNCTFRQSLSHATILTRVAHRRRIFVGMVPATPCS
jgi:hypothetical protein